MPTTVRSINAFRLVGTCYPAEWADATGSHQYSLNLTPAELVGLLEAVDALIRPYVRPIRQGAPDGSAIVHMSLRAFLNPDVYGNSGRQK